MRLIAFAIYVAIGAMLHAVVVGAQFDWSSAWTFAWLFGWPIMLFVAFGSVIIAIAVVAIFAVAAWVWLQIIAHWRWRRRLGR